MDDLHKDTEKASGQGAETSKRGNLNKWGDARDPDSVVDKANSDWRYLSDPNNLKALADIDLRSAREELIREWDQDVSRALRREMGILDMGARFLDFMENEAPTAETAEELMRGADATLGYMIHDVKRLAEKREKLMKQLHDLKAPPVAADVLLRRLGAADPAELIRNYEAASRAATIRAAASRVPAFRAAASRAAEKQEEAQAALSAVVQVNANAAAHVKSTLEREKGRRPLALTSTEAERIFPVLRALLDEKRLTELKNSALLPAALRDSLSAWAGEIQEKLITADRDGRDSEE